MKFNSYKVLNILRVFLFIYRSKLNPITEFSDHLASYTKTVDFWVDLTYSRVSSTCDFP